MTILSKTFLSLSTAMIVYCSTIALAYANPFDTVEESVFSEMAPIENAELNTMRGSGIRIGDTIFFFAFQGLIDVYDPGLNLNETIMTSFSTDSSDKDVSLNQSNGSQNINISRSLLSSSLDGNIIINSSNAVVNTSEILKVVAIRNVGQLTEQQVRDAAANLGITLP